jgi:AcrR family transcriptional regulator
MPKDPTQTRSALIDAARKTLQSEGFAGTTARAIASRAGVNQALVFYHFGGVDPLLLEALDASAAERLARYTDAMAGAPTPAAKVDAARALYREDVENGHVTVIAELLAASLARPELQGPLLERMQPWLDLVRTTLTAVAGETPLASIVDVGDVGDVASAVVALYLGLNLLSRLDPTSAQADSLFDLMERLAPLLSAS